MNEQLDLFETIPTEEWVFDVLKDTLDSVIIQNNVALDKLICKNGKSYSSVWYDTQLAFRICSRNDHHYFGVSNAYTSVANEDISRRITKSGRSDGFTNYAFDPTKEGVLQLATFLAAVLDMTIDSVTKEFDCCSRYEECSNAKRCTNPNASLATGCGYRKVMKKGRIFYGENRNVD